MVYVYGVSCFRILLAIFLIRTNFHTEKNLSTRSWRVLFSCTLNKIIFVYLKNSVLLFAQLRANRVSARKCTKSARIIYMYDSYLLFSSCALFQDVYLRQADVLHVVLLVDRSVTCSSRSRQRATTSWWTRRCTPHR